MDKLGNHLFSTLNTGIQEKRKPAETCPKASLDPSVEIGVVNKRPKCVCFFRVFVWVFCSCVMFVFVCLLACL